MKHATRLVVPLLASLALAWGSVRQRGQPPRSAADRPGSGGRQHRRLRVRQLRRGQLARAPADRKVTFILNVNPGQDPSDGPNYFNFDDDVLYAINIDNNRDGRADDVVYEVRFKTREPADRRPGRARRRRCRISAIRTSPRSAGCCRGSRRSTAPAPKA